MTSTAELHWLAGLLEGEGCFGFSGSKPGTARVVVTMTDRDVVERAAKMLGSAMKKPYVRPAPLKTSYSTAVYGSTAAAWMMTLYVLMGERRRRTIEQSLAKWRAMRPKNGQNKGRRNPRGPWEARCAR